MRALASARPFPAAAPRRRAGEGPKPGANPSRPARRGCRRLFAARDGHDAEGPSTRETEYVAKTATQATDAKENLTESQQVQRDLALRMMEAQSRWLEAPGTPRRLRKKSKRRPPVDADPAADATPTAASSEDVAGDEDLIGMDAETVVGEAWERGRWLLGLLVLQSSSSVVLQHYDDLVRDNLIITLFLTMLVGAGGNAGNQSAIRVIRGLATGEMVTTRECFVGTLWRQARVGFLLASFLSAGGFARVMVTEATGGLDAAGSVGGVDDPPAAVGAFGIALSLFCIVTLSTVAGTAMPFALAASGQDPANAGTTIQVVMDIMGVVITCVVCSLVFTQVPGMLAAVGG